MTVVRGLSLAENPLEDRVHMFGVIGYWINIKQFVQIGIAEGVC